MTLSTAKGKFGWELIVDDLKDEVAQLNDVINDDKQDIQDLKSELRIKTALVNNLRSANDSWSNHFKELDDLAQKNAKELDDLKVTNEQLKGWLLLVKKSKQEMAISYSEDIRTLRAMEERYSNNYAQHIRNTPLPE